MDKYGFSALPGGFGSGGGGFHSGGIGGWWSTSEDGSGDAYSRFMYYNRDDVDLGISVESFLLSVRCLQD